MKLAWIVFFILGVVALSTLAIAGDGGAATILFM